MRRYESVWVVNGDLPDEEIKGTIDKFSRIISTQGGALVRLEEWGRKKLAYRIQGVTRGYYVMVDYAGTPATVKELSGTTASTTASFALTPPRNPIN